MARTAPFLEGYELLGRARQLALEALRRIKRAPAGLEVLPHRDPAEMIPAEYRKSGFTDWARQAGR